MLYVVKILPNDQYEIIDMYPEGTSGFIHHYRHSYAKIIDYGGGIGQETNKTWLMYKLVQRS